MSVLVWDIGLPCSVSESESSIRGNIRLLGSPFQVEPMLETCDMIVVRGVTGLSSPKSFAARVQWYVKCYHVELGVFPCCRASLLERCGAKSNSDVGLEAFRCC